MSLERRSPRCSDMPSFCRKASTGHRRRSFCRSSRASIGKHLLGLFNTVLDISKIEAGQFKLNLGEYALGSIVETVMGATESLAATKKLTFKAEVAKGLPYGLGDEQRLTQ